MKAILFDLDETLLDRAASVKSYLQNQHLRYKLSHINYEVYEARFVELDERGYADKLKVFGTLISEFSLSCSAEQLTSDFRGHAWRYCKKFDGASDTLIQLRSRGYKLGIITNGTVEMQSAKLRESGLGSLVDVALISEQEGMKKPDPVIFMRAADRLGVRVEECVFVGDNPKADIWGAHHAGMKTVWFMGYQSWPADLNLRPDYKVQSLAELLSIEL